MITESVAKQSADQALLMEWTPDSLHNDSRSTTTTHITGQLHGAQRSSWHDAAALIHSQQIN
jgi:hypothetical protein